jgi:hypothetical protein
MLLKLEKIIERVEIDTFIHVQNIHDVSLPDLLQALQ